MFRLLLILTLVFYVLYKLGLFRVMVTNARDGYQETGSRPADGNVNIDSMPKEKKKSTFKGGDYVDYEEVK